MSNTNPKVSVLIAAYNIEKFIGQCISSVISQDYENLEIIVVDDCSSDSTGQICRQFTNDSRLRLIRHERNMRLPAVRNTGLDNASGDYIVFVDGDDWLAPDFVSYMLRVITETDSEMAINRVIFTTRDYTPVEEKEPEIWSPEKATYELLYPNIAIGVWNKIYRRSFIERHHLRFRTELFMGEGLKFITDAAQRCSFVGVGFRKVYYYRLDNSGSVTKQYSVRHALASLHSLHEIEKDLIIRTPLVYSALRHHVWLNRFFFLHNILGMKKEHKYMKQIEASRKYIRTHILDALRGATMKRKVKYILAALFPVTAARVQNYISERRLKSDMRSYVINTPPPPHK